MWKKTWLSVLLCVGLLLGLMLPVTVLAAGAPDPVSGENSLRLSARRSPGDLERPAWDLILDDMPVNRRPEVPDWPEAPERPAVPDPNLPGWNQTGGQQQNNQHRPDQSRNPDLDSVPRTGDESGVAVFASLAAASFLCAAAVVLTKKNTRP